MFFLATFECALLGLNPTFYADDSPEMITVAATLGIAHPPGYPLWVLMGRLMSLLHLPLCFSVNLLSALFAASLCLLVFFLLEKQFKVPRYIAMAFALMWMAGASAYPSALSAKRGVYELAAVFLLAILASLMGGRLRLASFLFGLSLGGHWMTMSVYAPGLAILAYGECRPHLRHPRAWLEPALFFLLGLSLYLYLPLRAINEPLVNWGYTARLDPFLKHLSRYVDRGRDFSPDPLQWLGAWGQYLRMAFFEFYGVGLLAPLGLFFQWKKNRTRTLGLLALWAGLAASLGVFSKFSGTRLPLLEDYSVSSWALIAFFSGLGAWGLFQLWKRARNLSAAFGLVLLALALPGVGSRVIQNGQTHTTCAYDYTLNSWKALPKDSLYFCEGDILQFTGWYLQFVEGKRPDLSLLGSSMSMDWNRIQLARSHPGLKVPNPRHGPLVYDFGPLFSSMVQDNPQKRYFFSFFPQGPILKDLILSPRGLAREGTAPAQKFKWEEGANQAFWGNARLRHLNRPFASEDQRTWDNLLQDYGAKRQALALYEMNLSATDPGRARDWLQKGLDQLMVVKDWNPPGSEALFEFGTFGPGLGPLLGAYVFHREILIDIGVDYFLSGDRTQAESWIQQATQAIPQVADLYFYAGMAAVQAKNYPEARKWLQGALALDPTHAQATRLLRYVNR